MCANPVFIDIPSAQVTKNLAGLHVRTATFRDTWLLSPAFPMTDGPHAVEIEWGMASSPKVTDGWVRVWLDGEIVYEYLQLANFGQRINTVQLGAVFAPLPGASRTYCLDEFVSATGEYTGTLENVNICGEGGMVASEGEKPISPSPVPVARLRPDYD